MKGKYNPILSATLACLACAVFLFSATPLLAADMTVYDDALQNGWADWSWGTHSLTATAYVHSGAYAISYTPSGWTAVYLHLGGGVSGSDYDGLEFWVNGGAASGQSINVVFLSGSTTLATVPLTNYLTGGPKANTWSKVRIPFDANGLGSATFPDLYFANATGNTQATVYFDDIVITERPGSGGPLTVSLDPDSDRHSVSPLIYGVSSDSLSLASLPLYPVFRWGGNATTRYSWQVDASNRASDWFFINYPNDTNVSQLPNNSTADRWIDAVRAHGSQPLLTVPLIGWTPKDRNVTWGFSIAKYGAQQYNECSDPNNQGWCHADAGNGVHTDGTTDVTGNDPTDTSVAITPSFVTSWMAHIASRMGTAGAGGLKLYNLDNEPMLWNSTHRDVHPVAVDYAEIWQRTQQYASAMKAQDPAIVTLGPVLWGWCAYFYSAHDGCGQGTDYAAHGPFLEWYFSQVESYRQTNGVRLVDYLDIHYYPQSDNVALSDDESSGTAALRLRSVKSLYDTSYTDESWIGQPIYLVPRMKDIIARKAPGTKLAITEYNWGNDSGLTSALAQAEVLSVFAREGVDLACRWVAPASGTLVEDAFKFYLNYDGSGAKVEGDSVRAMSSSVDSVGAYAFRRTDNRLYVVLVNKATDTKTVNVSCTLNFSGSLNQYGFDGSHRLQAFSAVAPSGGAFSLDLPARSARLLIGQLACTLPASPSGVVLKKASGGANLGLTWSDVSGATDYVVYEDSAPNGTFATQTGTAASGTTGLTVAMPSGTRFYLVASRNGCGTGAKN